MFFMYAMLGAFVFILLDAPSMKRLEGTKAIIGLLLFYVIISGVYIGGASSFPQYDPEIEKGKIEKILKRRRAMTEQGKAEELIARAKVLNAKGDGHYQETGFVRRGRASGGCEKNLDFGCGERRLGRSWEGTVGPSRMLQLP